MRAADLLQLNSSGWTRRGVVRVGTLGLAGLSLPRALQSADVQEIKSEETKSTAARAKSCLLIYLDGGPSHIDLFDLKPEAPAEIRGPYRPIATSVPGLTIGELLPRVAQQAHRIVQVRSVCHDEGVHDPAVYQMLTGYKHLSSAGGLKVEPTDLPHIGGALLRADRTPAAMPKAIQLPEIMKMEARVLPGQSGGILGPSFDPFLVEVSQDGVVQKPQLRRADGVSTDRLRRRSALLREFDADVSSRRQVAIERLDEYQRQALSILESSAVQQAFDIETESAVTHEKYGRHRHGQSVLLARRLVEAGAKFVTVYWGHEDQDWADGRGPRPANNPWDTHRNHFPLLSQSLAPRADQTLAALLEDLAQRGLLDETLVVWMGDFGRTPRISKPWASRDHWPRANTILLAGAGLRGGSVFGATDRHAAEVIADPVSPGDLTATMLDALGVDPQQLVSDASGQPHRLSPGQSLTRRPGFPA
ncbi:hypothetical protein LBMAG52_17780 [Planctomycetia bacterium]|nr:hypothetical protein LBMAG52_17780 [Planctomycetia bacterium]